MSDPEVSFDNLTVDRLDPSLSTKEYLQKITDDFKKGEEDYLNTLSQHEREQYLQQKAEKSSRSACRRLKNILQERRKLLWSALYKPILMPASLIGAGIAGALAQGNIGLVAAVTGIAVDIGVTGWWLRKTILRLPTLHRQIQSCKETIREYQDHYGWEARRLLIEENIDMM